MGPNSYQVVIQFPHFLKEINFCNLKYLKFKCKWCISTMMFLIYHQLLGDNSVSLNLCLLQVTFSKHG